MRVILWAFLGVVTALGLMLFLMSLGRDGSAPQVAASSATYAAGFVGMYVFVRSIDSVLDNLEHARPK